MTRQGSRPGSSFADLFYGVTVPRILRWRDAARAQSDETLRGIALSTIIHWDGLRNFSPPEETPAARVCATPLEDVIWADDLAKCIRVPTADLTSKVAALECGLLADAFYAHGYSLSFGPTKTAAMLAPRGPGSRAVRRMLFRAKAGLPVFREEQGVVDMPLVDTYRHLGVKLHVAATMLPELRHRTAHAWSSFRQGRTRVFRCKRVSLAHRGSLLATHVLTKLLYAAGSWPPLRKGEHSFFYRTVLALYRQTLSIPHGEDQHLTHATICSLVQQPSPETLLHVERARYIMQLVQSAPLQLWALLRRDAASVGQLRDTLLWLYAWIQDTSTLGDPISFWEAWESLILQRPSLFKALIKRARGLELARTACFASLQAVKRTLDQVGGVCPSTADQRGFRCLEACLQCRIAFPDRTSWACHATRVHGYQAPASLLVADSSRPVCRACGRLYASIGRLKRHLHASAKCRISWGSFCPSVLPEDDPHERAPPVAVEGVLIAHMLADDPARVHLGLLGQLRRSTTCAQDDVWPLILEHVEPIQVLRDTLEAWRLSPGTAQPSTAVSDTVADLQLLLDPELWCEDFRMPRNPPMPTDTCPSLEGYEPARLSFVLTGAVHVVHIAEPPTRAFVHPFRASVPLAAARRQAAWLEASCDAICSALHRVRSSPVLIRAPGLALECLAPIPMWLQKGGFKVEHGLLRSPRG